MRMNLVRPRVGTVYSSSSSLISPCASRALCLFQHSDAKLLKTRTQWRSASFAQKAADLNQKGIDQELGEYDQSIAEEKEKQRKAPWHREGSQEPPVKRARDAGAMTKGEF